jgi:hypothetical protein
VLSPDTFSLPQPYSWLPVPTQKVEVPPAATWGQRDSKGLQWELETHHDRVYGQTSAAGTQATHTR